MTKTATAMKVITTAKTAPEIVMRNIIDLCFASEAPPELGLQVRLSDDSEGLPTLEASIRAHGVIVPLVVKDHDGKSFVTAGNRRLKILRKIYDELGKVDALLVQTIDSDNFSGDPREIAMATNVALPPHPVDRYEVIAALVGEGMSIEDAMMRFGMSSRQFNQVMKLGTLAPSLRDKWRSGEIDASAAQAFTLTDDQDEQIRIYTSVRKATGANMHMDAHSIRTKIVPDSQRELGALVEFLGVDELEKEGLIKQRDWFETNHVVTDPKAVKKKAGMRLDDIAHGLVDQHGWSWAKQLDPDTKSQIYSYGRLEPDKKGGYSAEQKGRSGCFVSVDREGKLSIDYGRVKPGEGEKATASDRPKKAKKKSKGDTAVVSGVLARRLSEQLQRAGAEALKLNHAAAAASIIAAISSGGHVLSIHVGSASSSSKPASFADVFAGALKATPQQREAMFAQIAAQALNVIGEAPLDDSAISDLFGAMAASQVSKLIAEEFDAKDYFASIGHGAIVTICRAALGYDVGDKVAKMKKPAAAKFAASTVPSSGWLPKQLRTRHYKGAVESMTEGELTKLGKEAAAKNKKAPAKKAAKKK